MAIPIISSLEVSNMLFEAVLATILGGGVAGAALMGARSRKKMQDARPVQQPGSRSQGSFIPGYDDVAPDAKAQAVADHGLEGAGSLLDFFAKGAIQELRPVRDEQYGARYIEIENLTKVEPRNVPALLERLAARGVLLKRTYERRIVCEVCSSSNLSPRYECTTCRSTNLERERVIEHVTCGHSGPVGTFEKRGNALSCPHCGVEFGSSGPEVNMKAADIVYSCQDCGASTRQPGVYFHCGGCDATVPTNGVAFANLYSYALARKSDLQSVVLLELISSMLREMGYQVEIPGALKGRSGIVHDFALAFGISGQVGVVTILQTGGAENEQTVREAFTSVFDCSPCLHVAIAIPNAGESVKRFAREYDAHVIEGGDVKGILRLLRSYAIGLRSSAQKEQRKMEGAAVASAIRKE